MESRTQKSISLTLQYLLSSSEAVLSSKSNYNERVGISAFTWPCRGCSLSRSPVAIQQWNG